MTQTIIRTGLPALVVLLTVVSSSIKAESLGEMLRDSGWDQVIGTWVDEDTQGSVAKVTYAWKFKDRVMEITTKMGDRKSVALVGVDAKTGEVFHRGADNEGGSSLGTWEVVDGDAVLAANYVTAEGREGSFEAKHHLEDDDTMVVTIDMSQPFTITLVRKKD